MGADPNGRRKVRLGSKFTSGSDSVSMPDKVIISSSAYTW